MYAKITLEFKHKLSSIRKLKRVKINENYVFLERKDTNL